MMPKSTATAYIDVLTTLFVIFVTMFLLSEAKKAEEKGNHIDPSQYLIELTWDDDSVNDVDLWVSNEKGEIVFFRDREIGGMTLDTDNMGINNRIKNELGEMKSAPGRREVISIRGIVPGTYTVNVMMYANRTHETEKVKVVVRKLNPYKEITERSVDLLDDGTEETITQFTVDEKGNFISKNETDKVSLFARLKT
jgi:uncharacterized protein YfaP (DUF2135 family)